VENTLVQFIYYTYNLETKQILKLAPSSNFTFTILLLCYLLVDLSILYQIIEVCFQTGQCGDHNLCILINIVF
jgi:hypothetical protein